MCVKKEPEEVSGAVFCEIGFYSSCFRLFQLPVISKPLHSFYIFPQVIHDADGIGNAEVKKECSLDHSTYVNNEGNST